MASTKDCGALCCHNHNLRQVNSQKNFALENLSISWDEIPFFFAEKEIVKRPNQKKSVTKKIFFSLFFLQLGLDEDNPQDFMSDEELDSSDEEYSSDSYEEDEDVHGGRKVMAVPLAPIPMNSRPIVTCCPRMSAAMTTCKLDKDLPRMPCGHFGVPTRDVAIQGTVSK